MDSVTAKLKLLVAADVNDTSSKLKNARKFGVQIVSLDEFLAMPPLTENAESDQKTAAENSGFDDLPLFS